MSNNKDFLSQEEIDALLKSADAASSSESSAGQSVDEFLSPLEQDALGEIGNITFGSAATALSTLLGKKVEITTPKVSLVLTSELHKEFPKPHVTVHVKYIDGFNGINLLVIKTTDASVIADLMMGGDGSNITEELTELHLSAVQEAMNQMMGSAATSMSTIFNRFVNISPPGIDLLDFTHGTEGKIPPEDKFIKVAFRLTIGDLIDSTIMQLLPVDFAKDMVATLMEGSSSADVPVSTGVDSALADKQPVAKEPKPSPQPAPSQPVYEQPPVQPSYQQPFNPQPAYQPMPQSHQAPLNRNINVQPVQFADLSQSSISGQAETNLNLLLDIPLRVTVELGRTQKTIKEILDLSQGSIIELDKLAGEPVDILVNNKLIAKGEVVVIDENFGVRVTDIVSQWDRVQKLQ